MGMSIRAKFHCSTATKNEYGQVIYEFYAAHGKGNEDWAKATPGGNFKIHIDNPSAQIFVPGKDYLLDITEAA
jgi:hypothetical protein